MYRPTAREKRAFAQRMQDPEFAAAYRRKKRDMEEKRRAKSSFDYPGAGGMYIPTREQYMFASGWYHVFETSQERNAADMVIYGYTCREKVDHDHIHIVNEKKRWVKTRINSRLWKDS